jgi:predicted ATPase/class 3 adenylate cyclase
MEAVLFTDIEGSTRLWEEHPEAMQDALARHDAILAEAVSRGGGRILKTTGDGMIAVFDSAAEAALASIEAQSGLQAERWESTGPLRARMGLHVGETQVRDGDLFGPVMNRAARIMAAGHGGQVLVSRAAADELASALPAETTLRDLGVHRLKDLTLPERLHQLLHRGLAADFPPPATLDSRPHNLPLQATEFIGRRAEMAAILVMLDSPSTRLLTITGPGGAGKTRLGLQVAAEQVDRFEGGVFFVDLSRETTAEAAFEAVVRALDLPVSPGGNPLEVLKARLRDSEMLLVLDNFEQVTVAASGVTELLHRAPRLKAIVTSREALRVRVEQVYPVPPLALPHPDDDASAIAEAESAQLFADRARAVQPDFAVDEGDANVVAEICLRLDGLPLAIELAAARLNVFTPHELIARLKDRLDILGAGGRDLPERQRTLWGAIGWSYELLDDSEQRLFQLMSVFSSARLDAVEELAREVHGAEPILDSLGSLVDKSLLRTEVAGTTRRFSMLLMIKEYAESRLAESPELAAAVRRAHAVYYFDHAHRLHDRLRSDERDAALADLALEIGNLRTAWRYWVEQDDPDRLFGLIEGMWALHEAKGWYQAAIELANDTLGVLSTTGSRPDLSIEELTLRTSLARALMAVRGYTPEVEAAFKQVLEMSGHVESGTHRSPVLRTLASYYIGIADFPSAAEIGRQLLEIGEAADDEAVLVEAHYVLGAATSFVGHPESGLGHLDEAIALFDPHKHGFSRFRLGPSTGVLARVASGLVLWLRGSVGAGIGRVEEALALARQLEHPYSLAHGLYHNGFLSHKRGLTKECTAYANELSTIAAENDYLVWGTLAQVLLGLTAAADGRPEEGLELTETAIDLYRGLTAPPVFWPDILGLRGQVHALAGKPERALELLDEAFDLMPGQAPFPEAWTFRGDFLLLLTPPDVAQAEEAYERAAAANGDSGMVLMQLEAMTRLVRLRREMGKRPDGSDELATIYASFSDGFEETQLVAARQVLGI